MRRRTLLATVAGAAGLLAGCPAGPRDAATPAATDSPDPQSSSPGTASMQPTPTTESQSPSRTATTAAAAEGTVSVVDTETSVPDVRVDVTLDRAAVTPEATARGTLALTNTGAERPFWFGYAPPLYEPWGEAVDGDRTGWVLQDPTYRESERASERCWKPTRGYGIEGRPETSYRLATGESVASSVEFWTAEGESVCLPTGRFRFDSEVRVGEGFADAERESWSVVFRVDPRG